MTVAGNKENDFRNVLTKFGTDLLKGKLSFGSPSRVYVSVDESIEFEEKIFLIEIDASNQAKLVAGQYTLLNILINEQSQKSRQQINCNSQKDIIFLVIHYYGKDGTKYNSSRSTKNFRLINNSLLDNKGMSFCSIHIHDFKEKINSIANSRELEKYLNTLIEN